MRSFTLRTRFFDAELVLDHEGVVEAPERLAFMVEHRWSLSKLLVYAQRRGWDIRDKATGEVLNAPKRLHSKLNFKRLH